MPPVNKSDSKPIYLQVHDLIASGIENGLHPAGAKLPSIRACAKELRVSNTTVELAYQRLVEEGYVEARRGSGYTICKLDKPMRNRVDEFPPEYRDALEQLTAHDAAQGESPHLRYDFAYDAVDVNTFPYVEWARISRDVLFSKGAEAACLYNDHQGLADLRTEISRYASSEYGIACCAEQVLVMPTTRAIIADIISLFDPAETVFSVENPGYDEVGNAFRRSGFTVTEIATFPYPDESKLHDLVSEASLLFTTPASQFPTNAEMPMAMREQLMKLAEQEGTYLIDDEYCWEFQSGSHRKPPLAALDRKGRVITLGTFSNSFTPAVCLSYAILPPQLMLRWREGKKAAHPQVPWQTQMAMATFMREGFWRKHVRKTRTAASKKRRAITDAIRKRMGDSVDVIESVNSLFVLVKTRDGRQESELVEAAANGGVRVYPTSRYWHGEPPASWRYVQIGFGGVPLEDIVPGIDSLADAWGL